MSGDSSDLVEMSSSSPPMEEQLGSSLSKEKEKNLNQPPEESSLSVDKGEDITKPASLASYLVIYTFSQIQGTVQADQCRESSRMAPAMEASLR